MKPFWIDLSVIMPLRAAADSLLNASSVGAMTVNGPATISDVSRFVSWNRVDQLTERAVFLEHLVNIIRSLCHGRYCGE